MLNRLQYESSPYLKQHENNPVDWHPWGAEALNLAKNQDKPILLSVGYSACHWCHVMAHESFENEEIAKVLNDNFISIKIDREERPDLDQIYQPVAQIFTRGGGWPLTVFLTPELIPFYGGTYFPPEDRFGRPGFKRLLEALIQSFKNNREATQENALKILEHLKSNEDLNLKIQVSSDIKKELKTASQKLLRAIDWHSGGLGSAPKFPNVSMLTFLWRMGLYEKSSEMQLAVLLTLEKMACGGIYDQLGGGFHRYSVDESWSVPHFEKMLYDNAELLKLYSEVLLTPDTLLGGEGIKKELRELFETTVHETVEYVSREMVSEEGLFFSAQDADSEGEEGKFFVWSLREIRSLLSPQDADLFCSSYGVTESGNFEHGHTVLYQAKKNISNSPELNRIRKILFKTRDQRIKPGLDDKVLVSWNSLMISGLVYASLALKNTRWRETAHRAQTLAEDGFKKIVEKNLSASGVLASTYQAGMPKLNGYLDDYAFLAKAALDLTRCVPEKNIEHLVLIATQLTTRILDHFKDANQVGYFFTSDDHEKLILRPKSLFDQALPSGTAVVIQNLIVLSQLVENPKQFDEEWRAQLPALLSSVAEQPYGYGELLVSGLMALQGVATVMGEKSEILTGLPHVTRKPSTQPSELIVICQGQTCSQPLTIEEAKREIIKNYLSD